MAYTKRDIEQIALEAVINMCTKNPYLSPYIDANDKTPSWDGHVYVYEKDKKDINSDFIARIPIQLKGTEDKLRNNKYNKTKIEDLKAYDTEDGVIYIVCKISGEEKELYYNSFNSLKLKRLLEEKGEQRSCTINLTKFPEEKLEVANIFYSFFQERKKQKVNPKVLYMIDCKIKCDT